MTPLDELADLLRAGSPIDAWTAKHAADYERLWNENDNAATLVYLGDKLGDHVAVVRAVCACARMALEQVDPSETRPLRAIETAEAWADGNASLEEVHDAAEAAWLATGRTGPDDMRTMAALPGTSPAAMAIASVDKPDGAVAVILSMGETEHDLAGIVRQHVPCPALRR